MQSDNFEFETTHAGNEFYTVLTNIAMNMATLHTAIFGNEDAINVLSTLEERIHVVLERTSQSLVRDVLSAYVVEHKGDGNLRALQVTLFAQSALSRQFVEFLPHLPDDISSPVLLCKMLCPFSDTTRVVNHVKEKFKLWGICQKNVKIT